MSSGSASRRRRQAERHGHWAERAAAWLLRAKGYRIIDRRVRSPHGEIDLIARRGRVIAFVEVKARTEHDAALEAVTRHQAKRIVGAARTWIAAHGVSGGHDCRFDIITVSPYLWPRHLANAFGEDLW